MTRPTGVFKRSPEMESKLRQRYTKLSKADWSDLYFDLFRQINGEDQTDETIMQDAEKRLDILKIYRVRA
jgi:hypothetical protein